ncbi:hypothetical protein C8Q74DRAFT_1373997 [Fomes fomentarius]|nr:hypothetical protein C8Q74DRAFT_1373997 [Fomes fomentarius]
MSQQPRAFQNTNGTTTNHEEQIRKLKLALARSEENAKSSEEQAREALKQWKQYCEGIIRERNQLGTRVAGLEAKLKETTQSSTQIIEQTQANAKNWEAYYWRVAGERDQLRKTNTRQLTAEAASYKLQVQQLQGDLACATKKRQDMGDLLQRRNAELRDAEAYLTLIDDVADSEVAQIVEHLNGQIFQSAAIISDAPEFSYHRRPDAKAADAARARLEQSSCLGSNLLASLRRTALEQDSVLVQLALQAGMVEYTRRLGNRWDISSMKNLDAIGDVYRKMRETEPQAVAGRWRILCRTYTKLLRGRAEDSTRTLFDALSSMVTDILIVCGAAGTREKLLEMVAREYESELQSVLKLALQFQRTAGERVVSSDFTILAAKPGAAFDSAQMEDARATTGAAATPPSTNEVLCTTELGLVMEKTVGEPRRSNEPQATGIQSTVLKRCKVVLAEKLDNQSIDNGESKHRNASDIGSEWPQDIVGDANEHVPVFETMDDLYLYPDAGNLLR